MVEISRYIVYLYSICVYIGQEELISVKRKDVVNTNIYRIIIEINVTPDIVLYLKDFERWDYIKLTSGFY